MSKIKIIDENFSTVKPSKKEEHVFVSNIKESSIAKKVVVSTSFKSTKPVTRK